LGLAKAASMSSSSHPSSDPVAILESIVPFRTDFSGEERPLADRLARLLGERKPDEVSVVDVPRAVGKPASYVYARYGSPKVLVNAHLDTVPPNADWTSDPFVARIDRGRLHALGASDTKGAVAAILAALADVRPKDIGILFSGDEESGSASMRAFLEGPHRPGLERAIVCEPTNLAVGTRHRGFIAFDVSVTSPGGHSSRADTMVSPIGVLARLAVAYDDWAAKNRDLGPPGFPGMCVNLAKLDGGVAFNVIPAHVRLTVSLRPPPGADADAIRAELDAMARVIVPDPTVRFFRTNDPFATRDVSSFVPLVGDAARAPIDLAFWTEAAMLSAAGVDAIVMGTGSIGQAHTPDEWVSTEELHQAKKLFASMFERSS
jgi:acetylornithine deacetylase